ncbi:MAG: cytochrome c oxidase subunit II [Chloroflexaceae bacterium]|jgi:cytochrome c oxidase subunit 2|nr:cytochrome c oxidase subunit II [Chloroflexaceae bacterium]
MGEFQFYPEQASTIAGPIDALYWTLTGLTLLFSIPIPFVILYFMVKYHHSRTVDRGNPSHTSMKLELGWTFGLLGIALGIFFWSSYLYFDIYRPAPANTLDIYVTGRQWMWHTQHPQGKRENNELHVPVNTRVRLIMTSQDVIHSFFIPAFRVKRDVLPGRYTTMWFEATKTGEYRIFCTEYCGTEHAAMGGRVVVMELADYQRWLREDLGVIPESAAPDTSGRPSQPPSAGGESSGQLSTMAAAGQQIFIAQGCIGCHGQQGRGRAPSLAGLYGAQVQLENGQTLTADENYIRESILNPRAQIVAGYPPIMPPYDGILNDQQINELIEYIRSLTSEEGTTR